MLSNPEIRNWISTILAVIIICGIFGSDLLYFQKAGTTADVGLIVAAVGALGLPVSFGAGKRAGATSLASKDGN